MTREKVKGRIEALLQDKEKLMSTLAAFDGALQDCYYWLAEFDREEKENAEKVGTEASSTGA